MTSAPTITTSTVPAVTTVTTGAPHLANVTYETRNVLGGSAVRTKHVGASYSTVGGSYAASGTPVIIGSGIPVVGTTTYSTVPTTTYTTVPTTTYTTGVPTTTTYTSGIPVVGGSTTYTTGPTVTETTTTYIS